ncbi:hypothetical protein [Sinomonas atrocyanea]|jgi:hypothetical protein|uniref:hypothetical protein n=1 Tax=Sinomonas atrocyanea TaxID=37927 RepID=UPI00278A0E89|nr:hypothetical protein [Sinomonas atrocyanea]MDP9886416.1 hypothetical protein [Sinomonas atrocyanea]MDR6623659.1 hypothetical protein [Sinomonas atrocyanea]
MQFMVALERERALVQGLAVQREEVPPARPEKINFRDEVASYASDLEGTCTWPYSRFPDIHGEEIDDV